MKTLSSISILFLIVLFFIGFVDKDKNSDYTTSAKSSLVVSSKKLDANTISTWFSNEGSFNRDPITSNAGFEWPKGTGITARYASGPWLGAKVGNDTLVTMAEYSYDFLPGYTDNNGIPHGKDDPLYRVYKLTYGLNDLDRLQWPNALLGNSDQGAPVYFDGYSWHPLDFGTQTMYYVYTDSYPDSNTNRAGSTAPLKVDIKQLNFSIDFPGPIGQMAFSQFTVINRSTNTWNDFYLSIWTDDDLGFANDDKVGCDSALNLGYTYNATNNDQLYGTAPPAVGFLLLRGAIVYTGNNNDTVYICKSKTRVPLPRYRDLKMSVFNWYANGDSIYGDPRNYYESYRIMEGLRRDGSPIVHPNGYVTKYVFSGNPVNGTGWNQAQENDQRFLMSTGPVNMLPGDTQVIVTAQIIARGSSNLNSITLLKQYCAIASEFYNSCYNTLPIGIINHSALVKEFHLYQNYPNPFNPTTQIKFDLPKDEFVTIKVYNVLGKEVAMLLNEKKVQGSYNISFDGSSLPSGVYFYRLQAGDFTETKKMVLIK